MPFVLFIFCTQICLCRKKVVTLRGEYEAVVYNRVAVGCVGMYELMQSL